MFVAMSTQKKMFGSSLPPVVCRRVDVLFTLFVFACNKVNAIKINVGEYRIKNLGLSKMENPEKLAP
jgi:hypothetical protein